jgi:hypothetical protein
MIVDTCTTIKNGKIVFNGKKKLSKGIYSLVGQGKITHVAQVERNPVNITSYNIVKVIDSIYGSERKFQVVTAGVNEKDTTKISLRLRLLENKA